MDKLGRETLLDFKIIDLSQIIVNKGFVHPTHAESMIWDYVNHEETRKDLGNGFSYASKVCQFSDHAGTHVDAFAHFNPYSDLTIEKMDINMFFGEAICIDVSFVPELTYITIEDLQIALKKANLVIEKGDIVLLYSGMYDKYFGRDEYLTRQPGLNEESSIWLFEQKIKLLGIDAVSTDTPADQSFPSHRISALYGITHIENLANLKILVGKRFIFCGFPIKIEGGTGAPIRAVAFIKEEHLNKDFIL